MSRICTVCTHPDRRAIDEALILDNASLRDAARQFGLSKDSLARHKGHIAASLTKAKRAKEEAETDSLLEDLRAHRARLEELYQTVQDLLQQSLQSKDIRTALRSVKSALEILGEARSHLELQGKLTGEFNREQGTNSGPMVLVLPPLAPLGSRADLRMKLPPEAEIEAMVKEGRASEEVRVIEAHAGEN